jgi:alpha-galactosidase
LVPLFTAESFGAASRGWHEYLRGWVLPHPDEIRSVVYNSREATEFAIDDAGQAKLVGQAASPGAKSFVVHGGWLQAGARHRPRRPDRQPRSVPRRARHGARAVGRAGRVNTGSDLYRRASLLVSCTC